MEAGKKNVLCCRWELLTALQLVIPQQPDRLQWSLARHDAMLHKALSLATSLRLSSAGHRVSDELKRRLTVI